MVLERVAIIAIVLLATTRSSHALVHKPPSRRNVLSRASKALTSLVLVGINNPSPSLANDENGDSPQAAQQQKQQQQQQVTMFATPSGLKYFDLREGQADSPTPRYGQLLSIKYTGYIKLPNGEKRQKFDSSSYLVKHGNGRTVPGLDEGLHTMRKGGIRRLVLPPKLGYVESGLGPLPESPLARMKLSSLLDDMVATRGGNVIFDVELVNFMNDEADQGYYEDASLTPDQFDTLRTNLQKKASDAQKARGEQGATSAAVPMGGTVPPSAV